VWPVCSWIRPKRLAPITTLTRARDLRQPATATGDKFPKRADARSPGWRSDSQLE